MTSSTCGYWMRSGELCGNPTVLNTSFCAKCIMKAASTQQIFNDDVQHYRVVISVRGMNFVLDNIDENRQRLVGVIDNRFNVGKIQQMDKNIRPATEIETQWAKVLLNVSA